MAGRVNQRRISKSDRHQRRNADLLTNVGALHKHSRTEQARGAAAAAAAAIPVNEEPLSAQYLTDLARGLVELLLRSGNLADVLDVFHAFQNRPEMVGLQLLREAIALADPDDPSFASGAEGIRERFVSKTLQTQQLIVESVAAFINARLKDGQGGIRMCRSNSHVASTMVAASYPKGQPHLFSEYCRLLQIPRSRLQLGITLDNGTKDLSKRWTMVPPKMARSTKYSPRSTDMVYQHLLDISFENNQDKSLVRKSLGLGEDGKEEYCLVSKRIMPHSQAEALEMFKQSDSFQPWLAEAKRSRKNPVCSLKVIKEAWGYGEFGPPHGVEVCVCPHCTLVDRNQPSVAKAMAQHHQAGGVCTDCEGLCTPGSRQRALYGGESSMMEAMMCPKVHHPHLDIPRFDNSTGEVDWCGPRTECWLYRQECADGKCNNCGFKALFPHAASAHDIGTAAEGNEATVYGCPALNFGGDGRVKLYAFQSTPDGFYTDKTTGKQIAKTRRDWVQRNLPIARAAHNYQTWVRKHLQHIVPVRTRRHMLKVTEFWHGPARAVWHARINTIVDDVAAAVAELLVEGAWAAVFSADACADNGTDADNGWAHDTGLAINPLSLGCYRPRCRYGPLALDAVGPACYSPACAARQRGAVPVPPPSAFGEIDESTDFSAACSLGTGIEETCTHARAVNNDVWVVQHSPKETVTANMPEGPAKIARMRAGVTSEVERITDVLFAFSMNEHDKKHTQTVQRDWHHFLQHGVMHPDTPGCMWIAGKRVIGSIDFSEFENQEDNGVDYYPPPADTGGELPFHTQPFIILEGEDSSPRRQLAPRPIPRPSSLPWTTWPEPHPANT